MSQKRRCTGGADDVLGEQVQQLYQLMIDCEDHNRALQRTIEADENELYLMDVMEGLRQRWANAEELVKRKEEEIRRLNRDFDQLKQHCASVEDCLKQARAQIAYQESEKQTMQVELSSLNRKIDLGRDLLKQTHTATAPEDDTQASSSTYHGNRSSKKSSSRFNDASIDFDITGDSLEGDSVPELPSGSKYTKRSRGNALDVVRDQFDTENEIPNKRSREYCSTKSALITKESPKKKSISTRDQQGVGIRRSMNRSFSESNLLDAQNEERREVLAEINRQSVKTSSTHDVRAYKHNLGLGPSWTNGSSIEGRAHRFESFRPMGMMGDFCDVCNSRMKMFVGKDALKCNGCPLRIHKNCLNRAPTPCIPRGSGTPKTPNKNKYHPRLKDFCPLSCPMIPAVIIKCVIALEKRLDSEGIYRIPAQESEVVKLLGILKSSRPFPKMELAETETITGCIKRFLKDLSDSLIPTTSFNEFENVVKNDSESLLNNAILELPYPNRDTLAYLCIHLHKVAANSQINKMPLENLARCIAPTVIGNNRLLKHMTQQELQEETLKQVSIMKKILDMPTEYWKRILECGKKSITAFSPNSVTVTSSNGNRMPMARRELIPQSPRTPMTPAPSVFIDNSLLGPIRTPPTGSNINTIQPVSRRALPLFDKPY